MSTDQELEGTAATLLAHALRLARERPSILQNQADPRDCIGGVLEDLDDIYDITPENLAPVVLGLVLAAKGSGCPEIPVEDRKVPVMVDLDGGLDLVASVLENPYALSDLSLAGAAVDAVFSYLNRQYGEGATDEAVRGAAFVAYSMVDTQDAYTRDLLPGYFQSLANLVTPPPSTPSS